MTFYYKITVCPDPTIYQSGFDESQISGLKTFFSAYTEGLLSTEHHMSGVAHYEGIIGTSKQMRSSNLKRKLFDVLGVSREQQLVMCPSTKKHMIVIKEVHYLPGAIVYVMKEGRGDLVKKGMTDTWISEQVLEGKKNKMIKMAESIVFINDANFEKEVTAYIIKNDELWEDLDRVLEKMFIDYNFSRVRNPKVQYAHLMARHCNDFTAAREIIMNWKPSGNRIH